MKEMPLTKSPIVPVDLRRIRVSSNGQRGEQGNRYPDKIMLHDNQLTSDAVPKFVSSKALAAGDIITCVESCESPFDE